MAQGSPKTSLNAPPKLSGLLAQAFPCGRIHPNGYPRIHPGVPQGLCGRSIRSKLKCRSTRRGAGGPSHFNCPSVVPVSYTHLDVYKRQPKTLWRYWRATGFVYSARATVWQWETSRQSTGGEQRSGLAENSDCSSSTMDGFTPSTE